MEDPDDATSLVARLGRDELAQRELELSGRMKRKMHALNKLAGGGVGRILISDGRVDHPITHALAGAGTWIE